MPLLRDCTVTLRLWEPIISVVGSVWLKVREDTGKEPLSTWYPRMAASWLLLDSNRLEAVVPLKACMQM